MRRIGPLDPSVLGKLSADKAVNNFRALLYCEARYACVRPDSITISTNLNNPDGGIDAQFDWDDTLPRDTFLRPGRIGFQIKTGTSFKPWQKQAIKKELLTSAGDLAPEIRKTLKDGGHYFLLCFGHDFSPQQRNKTHHHIVSLLTELGFNDISSRIEIFGQAQIAAYIERYPSLRLALHGFSDEGFMSVKSWSQHDHMQNEFLPSEVQGDLINQLRKHLRGDAKHLRVLGEPGIGKTRLVLESVLADDLAPNTIYVPHGENFAKTALFREILRTGTNYPLIVVLDELSSSEMSEIWAHLKQRCGALKLISIDHSPGRTHDPEIDVFTAPRLPDQTIMSILASHVCETRELNRWCAVCEGSPRVAQAVGENLAANPKDILRQPTSVPLWDRFLSGYAKQDSTEVKQLTRVMRHLALFSRFGFEAPVDSEAAYIAKLVEQADPTVTWPLFQEIVQTLRARRILQGSRTLFIVPWALHIYLWREFWHWHGRGFDFVATFTSMPESLHGWFMDMFRYAHGSKASQIVKAILHPKGIFSNRSFLCSEKGTSFLSALAEADPAATLNLLERTIGTWPAKELRESNDNHQKFVWSLQKIAVWRPTMLGAVRLLTKLALTEKSNFTNNAAGTLSSLFAIGPEWAATEASPEERRPAILEMLRSDDNETQRLGLKVAQAALMTRGGARTIGPEHQGLKERANLWKPATYGELFEGYRSYWETLINETRQWPNALRKEANSAIIESAGEQLRIATQKDTVLATIDRLADDKATDRQTLTRFIIQHTGRFRDRNDQKTYHHLRRLNGRLARQNLESRFQRYVLETSWDEWDVINSNSATPEHTGPRKLLHALANRVARNDEAFGRLASLIATSTSNTGTLFAFGEALCAADEDFQRLEPLLANLHDRDYSQGIRGYFSCLRNRNPQLWKDTLLRLMSQKKTAMLGADVVWGSGFNNTIFDAYLHCFECGWINATNLQTLTFGKAWKNVSPEQLTRLLLLLAEHTEQAAANTMVTLLDQILMDENWPITSDLLFQIVTSPVHFQEHLENMHSYHWRNICDKLVSRFPQTAMPLLDVLLQRMGDNIRLSYDDYVEPMATALCQNNPDEAWDIVAKHLLEKEPKWRYDIMHWLMGGMGFLGEEKTLSPLAVLPREEIFIWISENPEKRASLMAHSVPGDLDEEKGGAITRHLLAHYAHIDGVISGVSSTFHSGGWTGPRSNYLRNKRTLLRDWLSRGYEQGVVAWIEHEITHIDQEIDAAEISEEREPWRRP